MKGFINRTIFALLGAMAMSAMADTVKLENIEFAALSGDRFQVLATFSGTPPEPTGYTIDNPARIVIDMPGVESALDEKKHALSFENARSAVVLTAGDKTRMILNMVTMANYSTRVDGNKLIVDVGSSSAGSMVAQSGDEGYNRSPSISSGGASIENIDFRRGENGQGLITIDLSDPRVNVDINHIGNSVTLDFYRTALPENLDRRLDVVDFATPVRTIDTSAKGANTTIAIEAVGEYDYLAYQADGKYVVSIKPLTRQELEEKKSKFAFTGEKLSLNMQDIPVRSVLQVIADFTKLNLVASDTVSGSITLRLENVPWDQALDIILKAKGLDKRQEGNVIMVAPAAEIAEQERLQVEANKQLQELAPLRTEFVRIRYADARELFDLFVSEEDEGGGSRRGSDDRNATSSILSERGSAIVDERTNTIILTDTEEKIADFRRLIKEIDIPIKQVVIESRIVIANTDFREELGVKWGFISNGSINGNDLVGTGRRNALTTEDGIFGDEDDTLDINRILAADLGVANPTGSLALAYISDNYYLDLELSALEDAGRGEIVSQPKVITGDKQEAVIQTGTEIPYQEASSSGATSVSFKEAVLKLEVTPQITPDNRIIMNLFITQDSLGDVVQLGEASIPTIDLTRIRTQALVGNGQTMVLGGIFQVQELERTEKVPLLGDIPFVGRLFRKDFENYQKREILIFITPKIISDQLLDTN